LGGAYSAPSDPLAGYEEGMGMREWVAGKRMEGERREEAVERRGD